MRAVVASVERPVNVLATPAMPPATELAEAGASRISVGGAFAWAAYATLIEVATELRDLGTYGYFERTRAGAKAGRKAFA